ncbi:MAG: hypothetical protein C0609_01505 [Deltaproteobacteria bacterium]|nr:MAG: hypothetical protein C0609_01505 [Deltaproteobacteria bacterium]
MFFEEPSKEGSDVVVNDGQEREVSSFFRYGLLALLLLVTNAAFAVDEPNLITFTLEGCRMETKGANFDEYTVTCADPGYTAGNLGD